MKSMKVYPVKRIEPDFQLYERNFQETRYLGRNLMVVHKNGGVPGNIYIGTVEQSNPRNESPGEINYIVKGFALRKYYLNSEGSLFVGIFGEKYFARVPFPGRGITDMIRIDNCVEEFYLLEKGKIDKMRDQISNGKLVEIVLRK